jgi:hypothetical protein
MKVIIDMVSFLYYTLGLILPFILVISCEGLTLPPLASRGVHKITISKSIPQQQGCVLSLLIKLDNTSQKGKELKMYFSNLNKALPRKSL